MRLDNLPVTCNYLVKKVKQIMFAEAQVPRLRSEVNWRGFRPVLTWWLDLSNHRPDTRLWLFHTFTPGWLAGRWEESDRYMLICVGFPPPVLPSLARRAAVFAVVPRCVVKYPHNTAGMLSGQPSAAGHSLKPRWQTDRSATRANVPGPGRGS